MSAEPTPDLQDPPRWLDADELETWQALNLLVIRLPSVLGAQLQRDAQLSLMEYYVLVKLSEQTDHTIRMSNLAVMANAELSRLSHMVRRLESRGFVRREPDPADGRFTHAILTDDGRTHLEQAAPGHVAQVRDLVFDVLGPEQQRALREAAALINAGLGTC